MLTFTYIVCAYGHIHMNMYIDGDVNVCIYTYGPGYLWACDVSACKKSVIFVVFG